VPYKDDERRIQAKRDYYRDNKERMLRQAKERYERIRGAVRAIKVEAGCFHCGIRHPAVLEFHHWDPANKSFRIEEAVSAGRALEFILPEIAKCRVVCANCHRIIHWEERQGT
jgi:hypothetical protein